MRQPIPAIWNVLPGELGLQFETRRTDHHVRVTENFSPRLRDLDHDVENSEIAPMRRFATTITEGTNRRRAAGGCATSQRLVGQVDRQRVTALLR